MPKLTLSVFFILFSIAQLVFSQEKPYQKLQARMQNAEGTNTPWAKDQPYVVMISIDGFRYDYAEKYGATNILKFIEQGVSTPKMYPSFPSKTFPNHYTLVTGMYPATHGIVANSFYDKKTQRTYSIKDPNEKYDGTWYGGTPLWNLAEKSGMLSSSFFWVGSEADIEGIHPNYYYIYDGSVPNKYRFQQVVDWLKMDDDHRPHALFTYFSLVDDAGHRYGPDSEGTKKAVLEIDRLLGEFMAQLQTVDLPVNVVIVSDHGMAPINRGILVTDIVDLAGCEVIQSIPAMIYCDEPERVDEIYQALKEDGRITVYRKGEVPDYLHYNDNERIGDLILYTEAPTVILFKPRPVSGGTHGFNPLVNPDMGAFFAASGPALKTNYKLPSFANIHVYPLVAEILGLKVGDDIDGDITFVKDFLRKDE